MNNTSPDYLELALMMMQEAARLLKYHINLSDRKLSRQEFELLGSHQRKLLARTVMLGRHQGMTPQEIASLLRMDEGEVIRIQVRELEKK